MAFLWTQALTAPVFPQLSGARKTEVLVIGGGMAGVLCAKKLQEAGVDYLLVEANTIGSGITKGTTAVLTAQHDLLYQDLMASQGAKQAGLYLQANLQAVNQFRALGQTIDCDFEDMPSVMYTLLDPQRMQKEAEVLQSLGFAADFTTHTPMPFTVAGAVRYTAMGQFHPLKFLYGIARGLHILEHTFVQEIKDNVAYTKTGTIQAKKIIIATHFPFLNRHGLYVMKLYQMRSHVIAFSDAPTLGCTIDNMDKQGFYLRNYKDLLLIGGGDHPTGKKGGGFQAVREFAAQYFPEAREKYAWANQDCVSLDGVAYIGPYSPGLPGVFVATGFHLWGMSTSMVAAQLLTDLVLGRENPYAAVFQPGRSILHKQLFANLATSFVDFINPSPKRCCHMGCALKWNAAEHSWDCPCHGSRFDLDGHVLDNPAMHDLQGGTT